MRVLSSSVITAWIGLSLGLPVVEQTGTKAIVTAQDAAVRQAEICSVTNDEAAGVAACEKAVELGILDYLEWPQTERFYQRLASAVEARGDWRGVVAVLRLATSRFPRNSGFYLSLGDELVTRYDAMAEALGCYLEAVRHDASSIPARIRLGRVQWRLGRLDEARDSFDEALKRDPKSRDGLFGRAQVLATQGEHQDAIRILEHLAKLDPQDFFVWSLLGHSLVASGQGDAAVQAFQKLLEVNPSRADEAHCGMAKAWSVLGNKERARSECRKLLSRTAGMRGKPLCDCQP